MNYDNYYNNSKIYSYEEIVDKRLGLGRYQIIVIVLLSIIFSADGIEISTLSLILPILKNEWKISEFLQGLLGTVLFLGLFCGSLMAGFFIDRIGRKKTLEYVSLIQFILGIYSSTLKNVYVFLIIRGLFGFLLGFIIPLIPTLCTETIPAERRGKITVLVNISFSLGQFLATIIAWFCLDNLTSGNWRLMLIICAFPPLLVFFGSRRFLKESPRYVILHDTVENGIIIMNEIVQINNDSEPIYKRIFCMDFYKELKFEEGINENQKENEKNFSNRKSSNKELKESQIEPSTKNQKIINLVNKKESEKSYLHKETIKNSFCDKDERNFNLEEDYKKLKKWRDYVLSHHNEIPVDEDRNDNEKFPSKPSLGIRKTIQMSKNLFNDKYKKFTIGLWITWFSLNFTKYGLVFILPFFLNAWDQLNQEKQMKLDGMKSLILTTLGEGFSGILAYYLVDSPNFGRKYTLAFGQLFSSVFVLLSYFIPLEYGNYLILSLFFARLFVKSAFAVLYPFTAEIYHTSIRTLGVASSSAVGRIGSTIMPFISIKFFYVNMWLPFLIYFFVGIIGLFGTLSLPYDTQGKFLDLYDPLTGKNSRRKILDDF